MVQSLTKAWNFGITSSFHQSYQNFERFVFYVAAVLGPLTKREDFSFKGGDGLLSKSKSLVTLITESAIDELKADLGNELVKAYEEVP